MNEWNNDKEKKLDIKIDELAEAVRLLTQEVIELRTHIN